MYKGYILHICANVILGAIHAHFRGIARIRTTEGDFILTGKYIWPTTHRNFEIVPASRFRLISPHKPSFLTQAQCCSCFVFTQSFLRIQQTSALKSCSSGICDKLPNGLFVLVLRHSNSISVISWWRYDA